MQKMHHRRKVQHVTLFALHHRSHLRKHSNPRKAGWRLHQGMRITLYFHKRYRKCPNQHCHSATGCQAYQCQTECKVLLQCLHFLLIQSMHLWLPATTDLRPYLWPYPIINCLYHSLCHIQPMRTIKMSSSHKTGRVRRTMCHMT